MLFSRCSRSKAPLKFLDGFDQIAKFRGDPKDLVSLLKDLLQGLLEFDPEERLSAEEALSHPFFNWKASQNEVNMPESKEDPGETERSHEKAPPKEFVSKFTTPNPFAILMEDGVKV